MVGCTALAGAAFIGQKAQPLLAATGSSFKVALTTLFWVGEAASADNTFIANHQSYWDKDWQTNYGGVDHPFDRNGNWPAGFTPRENPFYVALPFGEFRDDDALKVKAESVPWFRSGADPLLKNRWIEISTGGRSCYAQWEDVGPCGEDDFAFVFGAALEPLNTFNNGAGLDVSPAVWHYLGLTDNGFTAWKFVDASRVPAGPWTEIITTSGNNR